MWKDKYDQHVYTESEICNLYLEDRTRKMNYAIVEDGTHISTELEFSNAPKIIKYRERHQSVEEFDSENQANWHMPKEYKELDIVQYLLDKCAGDEAKLQRVGHELLLYVDRNLLPLLQYLKYLTDTMRANNVIWGVGRGSSVASYVLYLLGVHRIDSMYYGLDIEEFLR